MPRTPRAEEFTPSKSPSIAVQKRAQTDAFGAVGQIGGLLQQEGQRRHRQELAEIEQEKRLAEERQRHRDRVAEKEFKLDARINSERFSEALSGLSKESDIAAATQAEIDRIDKGIAEFDGMSDEQKELLTLDAEFQKEVIASMGEQRVSASLKQRAVSAAKASYELSVRKQDIEGAREAATDLLESGHFTTKEEVELAVQKAIASAQQTFISNYATSIQDASFAELDSILNAVKEDAELQDKNKNRLEKAISAKKSSLESQSYSFLSAEARLTNGIISRLERGDGFTEEELDSLAVDTPTKELILRAQSEIKGGLGQDSEQYKELVSSIDEKFADDPIWTVGAGEISAEDYEKIYRHIEETGFDTASKFALISKVMTLRAFDAKTDKDLFGSLMPRETRDGTVIELNGDEISINDSQHNALRKVSNEMAGILEGSGGKVRADLVGMTYSDYADLFLEFQSVEFINRFSNIEPDSKEFDDAYSKYVEDRILEKKRPTAINILRSRVLSIRSQQKDLRSL